MSQDVTSSTQLPVYHQISYSFEYSKGLASMQEELSKETSAPWAEKERAFTGKYLHDSQNSTDIRIFADSVIDFQSHGDSAPEKRTWEKTAVTPIISVLEKIGAKNFKVCDSPD